MRLPLLLLLVAVVSWLLTGLIRRYALARNLLDIPNARSSHQVPTPRGGGLAIVGTFLAVLPILAWFDYMAWSVVGSLGGAGVWVALVGWWDDHGHIPAHWRLLAHFAGAAWVLAWLGGPPSLSVLGVAVELGWLGYPLAALYLVWLLNLYNFMDGIDGIAAIEAITVCLGGALVHWLLLPGEPGWILPLLLAAAVAGFLGWNFPPARIFMGDGGSGFLGLMLAALSLLAARSAPELLWCWLILLGVFVVDATFTLARRVLRREKFYEAHCSHAYQHAARRIGVHRPVSLAVGLINLGWLLPLALLVAQGSLEGLPAVLIAYGPLVGLAFYFGAGVHNQGPARSQVNGK
jgi:Fuc2NAc and GlcNAc transferase